MRSTAAAESPTFRKGEFVVNQLRDMEYRVQRVHRDGTITVQGWFPLRDGKRMEGCFSGDLTYRVEASALLKQEG